jgi:hypothetical protein
MNAIEVTRAQYRPERITTLFVGESAPISGDFFYYGNNAMLTYMRRAIESSTGQSGGDFLARFKAYGWYLDDLVLTPVNHLKGLPRKEKLIEAQSTLATRMAEYQPLAIVSLLKSIKDIVEAAAVAAHSNAPCYSVPFPGMGQQANFQIAMANLIPVLPRHN